MLLMVQECTRSEFGGIFGRCILGSDIPDWFPYKEEGPSVSFEVPRIIEEFTLCFVYSLCPDKMVDLDPTNYVTLCITVINYTSSTNQTKKAANFVLTITHDVEDHIWQANFSKRWFDLEAGDQVKVIADCGPRVNVKKIGVCLTYDTVIDGNMFPYASTSNKDAIVVIDDGDASIDHVAIESKGGHGDDQERSGGSQFFRTNRIKYSTPFAPWNLRGHCPFFRRNRMLEQFLIW
jgi:hypothetical protein